MKLQKWRVAGVVLLCVVAGVITGTWLVETTVAEIGGVTADMVGPRVSAMLLTAAIGWAALPMALSHDPRESDPRFPGTPRALVASLVTIVCSASPFAVPAGFVVLVSVFTRRSRLWSLLAVAALAASLLADRLFPVIPGAEPVTLPEMMIGLLVILAVTLFIGMLRGAAKDRHLREIARAHLEAREARQAERDRIARDVHDGLSHRLSLIALHAGGLASRSDLPREQVQRASEVIRSEAEAAVGDLRGVLASLDAQERSIDELVAAARDAGTPVEVHGETTLDDVPLTARTTVWRAVQEGLTNARKHAPGAPVTLDIVRRRGRLVVEMSNPVDAPGTSSRGYGLRGMAHRAAEIGGSLTVDQGADEFRWKLSVPRRRNG